MSGPIIMFESSSIPLDVPEDRRKMHFQKTISLGNILTIISIVGGLTTVYSQFKADIAVMQANLSQQREMDRQHEQMIQQLRTEIRDDIKDIKQDQLRIREAVERQPVLGRSRTG